MAVMVVVVVVAVVVAITAARTNDRVCIRAHKDASTPPAPPRLKLFRTDRSGTRSIQGQGLRKFRKRPNRGPAPRLRRGSGTPGTVSGVGARVAEF